MKTTSLNEQSQQLLSLMKMSCNKKSWCVGEVVGAAIWKDGYFVVDCVKIVCPSLQVGIR
jgi:hypothetical protein